MQLQLRSHLPRVQPSFFVSDEYFYFQFGMCTFYGYFHCVAVFHCFYGEYIVSVDIRNFVSAASFN